MSANRSDLLGARALRSRYEAETNRGFLQNAQQEIDDQKERQEWEAEQRRKEEARRKKWSWLGLAGTIGGGLVGTLVGGPGMGTMLGASLGGGLGREIGQIGGTGYATGQHLAQGAAPLMAHMANQALMDKYYGDSGANQPFRYDDGMTPADLNLNNRYAGGGGPRFYTMPGEHWS